jgi:hypothetical protein
MAVPAMRAVALAAILTGPLASAESPPAPPPISVDIGGQPIRLPPPPGWVLADTGSDDARAPFTRFVSREERVLAGFAPRIVDPEAPSGASLMQLGLAASTIALESEDIDPARFAKILAFFREDMPDAEVVAQDPDALAILVLVQARTETGEPMPDYVSATLMIFVRLKSRFVRLGLFDFTASAASAEAFKATAVGWLVALRAANDGPAQPAM